MDLKRINKLAYSIFGEKSSHAYKERGNKYFHGQRTAKLALELRKILFPEAVEYDQILTVAAWFHDIKNGEPEHEALGAKAAETLLRDYCDAEELSEICSIIAAHDDRYSERENFSDLIKLHQDADNLDHFGTFMIWTAFIYAVPHNQTMREACEWMKNVNDCERYRDEFNFELSRLIYDEKAEFQRSFYNRFDIEYKGEIHNIKHILNEYNKILIK